MSLVDTTLTVSLLILQSDPSSQNNQKASIRGSIDWDNKEVEEKDGTTEYNTGVLKRGILVKSSQKLTPNVNFFKFIHTSMPFCNLNIDTQKQLPLNELDIAWRKQDGLNKTIIDELFEDEEIENQFIPRPIQPKNTINFNKNLAEGICENMESRFTNWVAKRQALNNNSQKSRSLHRPTPVKNYKVAKDNESEEDVISEMRSLTVRPFNRDIQNKSFNTTHNTARMHSKELDVAVETRISGVSMKTKRKLLRWLEEINLIRKKAVAIKEFPQFCRNGVIFFDLINKLNGRTPILKGVHRSPKNITWITANFAKVLGYLRGFPKMNSRYLWAENLMMEGDPDVIWGFIDDVWYWTSNKISPFDISKHPNQIRSRSFNRSENFNSSICSFGKIIRIKY
jgi:hypothetical protein